MKKSVYGSRNTINPTPTAPRIAKTLTGDVGVALGHGVGTFFVDFTVVFTVDTVVRGAVVVMVVTSGVRTREAITEEVFPAVTVTLSE
jgi:hypothetical protein